MRMYIPVLQYGNHNLKSLFSSYCYSTISIPSMRAETEGKVNSSSGKLAFMYWKPLMKDCHSPVTDILPKEKKQIKEADLLTVYKYIFF